MKLLTNGKKIFQVKENPKKNKHKIKIFPIHSEEMFKLKNKLFSDKWEAFDWDWNHSGSQLILSVNRAPRAIANAIQKIDSNWSVRVAQPTRPGSAASSLFRKGRIIKLKKESSKYKGWEWQIMEVQGNTVFVKDLRKKNFVTEAFDVKNVKLSRKR